MRYVSNAFAAPQLCLNDGRRIELEDATFGGESSQDAAEIDEASSQGFFSSSQPTSITELIYGKNRIGRGTPKLPRQATADHDTDPDEWSPDEGDEEEGDMLGLPPTLQDMLRGDPHTGSNDDQTASTDWRTGPTSMRPSSVSNTAMPLKMKKNCRDRR